MAQICFLVRRQSVCGTPTALGPRRELSSRYVDTGGCGVAPSRVSQPRPRQLSTRVQKDRDRRAGGLRCPFAPVQSFVCLVNISQVIASGVSLCLQRSEDGESDTE